MKITSSIQLIVIVLSALTLSACESESNIYTNQGDEARTLTVMTHDSFSISEQLLEKFQTDHGVEVRFLKSGDAGTTINKAILTKDNPLADVLYGVDNTFLSRALQKDIFESYPSPWLSAIDDNFELDSKYRVLPVDYGDVCINYDRGYFQKHTLPVPQSLDDLLDPGFSDMLVVENPATSSPGLAFLLTTIGRYGDPGYLNYWQGLVNNHVLVVNDWEVAYNQEFSISGGQRPLAVSYSSSPAFEVIYSATPDSEPPTAAIVGDGDCFRQIEFVGILKGTQNRALAEQWIDFMLSPEFQEDIPLQMFVFPVNEQAVLDQVFTEHLAIPEHPAIVSSEDIAEFREEWINQWTQLVLR
ncbi:MAG: thiamine ABC transporter substrate binding subunit [Anaerolineales bacterium]